MPTDARYRRTDPDTSREAAEHVETTELEQEEVLDCIRSFGSACCIADDVVARSGISWKSATPRFRRLEEKGYIVRTGEKRRGASGRYQLVMVATEFSELRRSSP